MYGDYGPSPDRRRYRPIKRRPPQPEDMPDEATVEAIREKAKKYPNFTPEEIRLFMEEEDGRKDVTFKMTRAVLYQAK